MKQFKKDIYRLSTDESDITPPVIGTLTVTRGLNNCQIGQLNWTPATDNLAVTGYEVWRGNVGSEVLIATLGNVTSFTDSVNPWVIMDTSYYKIRAFDSAGNYSAYSNMDSEVMSGWAYNISSPGRPSSGQACLELTWPVGVYSSNAYLNTQLFNNPNLTTPFNGLDLWYSEGISGMSYQINTTGFPSAGVSC